MHIVIKTGLKSPFKNPIRKKGLILPYDIVKVFIDGNLFIKGRVKDLINNCPADFYRVLVSQKEYRIDLRQYRDLMTNIGSCCPELAKHEKRRKSGR